ncbi:MAG: molybdate transporter, ATPase subunit [Dehalococcoidales bacterium]|nr:molybdate transporter, ATPase subunit [Dehalococcoidales bacterium]
MSGQQGSILIVDDEAVTILEPEYRNIGMVYQDRSLFHHLSVAENILFGLRIRQQTKSAMKKELAEIASLVGVTHLLDRKNRKVKRW